MNPVALVGAIDASDLIGIAIVIVIMFVSVLWQWLVKSAQLERRMGQPGGAAPPAEPPRDQGVDDEIGEFLRRAAKRRGPQVPPAAPPPQAAVEAEVVEETAVGGQVTEHVQKYLNAGEFARRTSQLGGEVVEADTQFGEHLRQVFGHEVGRLAEKPGEAATPPAADDSLLPAADRSLPLPPLAAADLAVLLADIDSVRQAIVVNEVLRRPEERWA